MEVGKMPNTTISVYLNDEDYVKYIQNKEKINEKVREAVKEQLKKKEE